MKNKITRQYLFTVSIVFLLLLFMFIYMFSTFDHVSVKIVASIFFLCVVFFIVLFLRKSIKYQRMEYES